MKGRLALVLGLGRDISLNNVTFRGPPSYISRLLVQCWDLCLSLSAHLVHFCHCFYRKLYSVDLEGDIQ